MLKMVDVGAEVVLVKVPEILPFPLETIPVTLVRLSLVQLNVVPETFPLKAIVVIAFAEQMVCVLGVAVALGVGFTSTVAFIGVPLQPFAIGVIVKVTVAGEKVALIKVPEISPLPLELNPVIVAILSLVQLKFVPDKLPLKAIVANAVLEQIV